MTDPADTNQELRLHPGWWVRLDGEASDLEGLAGDLSGASPVEVREFDGRYYMRMVEFDRINESGDIETRASEVLRVVNGGARVQHGNNTEARVDAVARVRPDGRIDHFLHASSGSFRVRSRVSATLTAGDGSAVVPEPSITERAARAALNDPQAERALRIFGRDDADYRDLYHVLEIAEAECGDAIYSDGTVTRSDVGRFKHTANSVHALGDQARHGHETIQPPQQPMSFDEAHALIGRVLRLWLA